jgi:molecular chaperone GrpE
MLKSKSSIQNQNNVNSAINDLPTGVEEIEELKSKCEEYLNGWKRAKADYENLSKISEKKNKEMFEFATAALILELLPVYNHYKLALAHIPQDQQNLEWVKGIYHIKREFKDFFKKFEIEEVKTTGEQFNPQCHEAVSQMESDQPPDTIIKELQPGYLIKGRVIQPAKVIVSKSINNQINNNLDEPLLDVDSSLRKE